MFFLIVLFAGFGRTNTKCSIFYSRKIPDHCQKTYHSTIIGQMDVFSGPAADNDR